MLPTLRFGKYSISGMLGPGGVTETYLAHRPEDAEHLFAVKLLRPDRVEPEHLAAASRRFLRAGRQLIGLIRPGLCPILEVTDDPTHCFIVSEYFPGSDLTRLMDLGNGEGRPDHACLDPLLVNLIGAEVARILSIIHQSKPLLAHLNLGPGNIRVSREGEVKLFDTGIAASLRGFTLQPIESWHYAAPEILGKDLVFHALPEREAVAADLYSLGTLLYQMLTGRLPCAGDSIESLRESKLHPRVEGTNLSPQMVAALRALLAPDPEDRPQSALAVMEWLAAEIPLQTKRQQLIAKGISTLEKGTAVVSQEVPKLDEASGPVVSEGSSAEMPPSETPTLVIRLPRNNRRLFLGLGVLGIALILVLGIVFRERHTPVLKSDLKAPSVDPEMPTIPKRTTVPVVHEEENRIPRVAGHLVVDTVPPGAMVWVDGVMRGKTFADLVIGEGGHRIVVIAPGHRILREVVDTTRGVIIRRTLLSIEPPTHGEGFLSVECHTKDSYPIFLDDQETGLLCPVKSVPIAKGKHLVGIFLPAQRKTTSIEVMITSDGKETTATFNE